MCRVTVIVLHLLASFSAFLWFFLGIFCSNFGNKKISTLAGLGREAFFFFCAGRAMQSAVGSNA